MPHFYIRRVPDKLHLRWKRLAFALKADMREVVLDAIDAYVSAKEIEADPDCWKHPKVWKRVNPMIGKAISLNYFERQFGRAENSPAFENQFKRLHLNIRTENEERLLNMDNWDKLCGGEIDATKYHGKQAVGAGLDPHLLSTTQR